MSPYPGFEVLNIRSSSSSYWSPHVRGGQYNKLRYVDIKFGKMTTVTKVVITSKISNNPLVLSIYGTMDGRVFSFYKDVVSVLSLFYDSETFIETMASDILLFLYKYFVLYVKQCLVYLLEQRMDIVFYNHRSSN